MALGNYFTDMTAPKIDLYAARRLLAGRVMQNTTQGLIFRDGYGLTENFTDNVMAAEVRILRHRRPTIKSRTMGATGKANTGHFNELAPEQPRTKEYGIKIVEVLDRNIDVPDVLEHMIQIGALNLEAQGIEDQLTRLINAYTFAVQIAVKLNEDSERINATTPLASSLIFYNPSADSLTDKIFEAHENLDEGAEDHDIDTFKEDGRVGVFTPEGKRRLVNDEKSVFEVGSSHAAQLLEIGAAGGLETVRETDRTGYFGKLANIPLHMVSKPIWHLVEEALGLQKGALADYIVGMVVASEATGRGIAFQNSVKLIDNPRGQGYRLQPLTRWGVECWIPEGIQLIVKTGFQNPASEWTVGGDPDGEALIDFVGFNPDAQ